MRWEKKASGCKTRKYLKFPCSTGASQGLLDRSGMGYLHPTLVSAANPPIAIAMSCTTPRCYQMWHHNRVQFQGENGWQRKSPYEMMARSGTKRKVAKEIMTNVTEKEENDPKHLQIPLPCLGWATRMSTQLWFCCCSSITILQWQLLMDTLFCYLARSSLKSFHQHIHTYTHTRTPWDYIWHNTFQSLIKGRTSITLRTACIRLFTDCNETAEYCFN